MNAGAQKRAERRWILDTVAASSVFGAIVLGIPLIFLWRGVDYGVVTSWPVSARIALALAPMAPIAYAVYAFIAFYRSRDELQRRKISEAVNIAFVTTGLCTFAWGFLATHLLVPPMHSLWTFPALLAAYWAASWFVERRYR